MRTKLLTLAVIAGFLIAAVPALAQDTGSYTSTTPTVTTPTTTTPTTDTTAVEPDESSGSAGDSSSGGSLPNTGSETWVLLAFGGALAIGSALLLAREKRPRRNR